MKYSRRIVLSIAYLVLGVALVACAEARLIDSFWSGFGVGLIIVGALQTFRFIKYRTNDEYREKLDTEQNDERNKFISNKAWAWSGYFFVIIAAIGTVAFELFDKKELSMLCGTAICVMVIIYLIAYMILKRKY